MGKIRYQLIGQQRPALKEDSNGRGRLVRLLLVPTILLLIILALYYNCSETKAWKTESTMGPTAKTSTTTQRNIVDYYNKTTASRKDNYFVYTSKCRMPAINAFSSDVLKIFEKRYYKKCDASQDLITVNYDNKEQRYSLHLNEANVTCCYKQILRSGQRTQADNQYTLLPCSNFHQDFVVPQEVNAVITECKSSQDKSLLQQDAFSFIQPKRKVSNIEASSPEKPSILLWGIDSMSRMNFQRTMPLLHKYLREKRWFELQGYNKMGDNTFPNLMAVLTGFNRTRSQSVCRPNEVGGLDACPFLWKEFKRKGYITAYAEDWTTFATFNHLLRGFRNQPTDYYARPLMLAIENELQNVFDTGIPYCVGRRHYAEYVYDAAVQLTKVHRNQSTFGLFWTNSFSHNNFALPSSMDEKMLEYMSRLNETGAFEKSVILFFSDHGMRFGELRSLKSGFLEERMPILYIWLPDWFRNKYPEFADNLKLNRNRLTSPYDIYATLRHILELETPLSELPKPEGCPSCHSVFHEVSESRDCKEAGIDDHWCTCQELEKLSETEPKARLMAEQLVEATNNYLANKNLTQICQRLKLKGIQSVKRKIKLITNRFESYLIRYETEPARMRFEASADWNNKTKRILVSMANISRLTSYNHSSKCIKDAVVKKFCICVAS